MSVKLIQGKLIAFLLLFAFALSSHHALAQPCSVYTPPSYSASCTQDYYTAITASGTGVTSTITFTGVSCVSTYYNYFSSQGVTAPTGNTVNMVVNRNASSYTGYESIFIDWNNDNIYQSTESVGTYTYSPGISTHTFSFVVPTTAVTGSSLHMRVFLSEVSTGAPCTATYGETVDFYFIATCGTLPTITVSPPSASICSGGSGASLTASGAGSGGTYTWASSTGLSATTGSSVTATPSATTTYTVTGSTSGGCANTSTVTVSVNPAASSISGTLTVCAGSTTTLTDAGGGTWSSGATGVATVGSGTGVVTGVASGTATISYTLPTGCYATAVVTVNPLPSSISGTLTLCVSGTTTLSDGGGGSWSTSGSGVASVGSSSGVVTGVSAGTETITYTLPTGCYTTAVVTVNPLPAPISGTLNVCVGSTTTLTDPGGGIWTSASTGVATIGLFSGVVTGVAPGTSVITYNLSTGCSATAIVTVNGLPPGITGIPTVCVGSTTTLFSSTGGTWSSGSTGIATVGSGTGVVTGVSSGTVTITYMLPTGCYAATVVTVNALPSSITGTLNVCVGSTTTLSDGGGGTWSSGSTGVATVGSTTGIVTGVAPGTSVITYSLSTGCSATAVVTVNALPSGIVGINTVCVGGTTTLSDLGGGTWSSGATGVAMVGSGTGIVTGVSAGTATISYVLPTGCYATMVVTVNPLPSAIAGTLSVCVGSSTTLTDAGGGTWTSSSTGVATVGSSTGIVNGLAPGTSVITYTLGTGCATSAIVTVNSLPSSISGTLNVCVGSTTTLSDAGGGTWTSSAPGIASIGSYTGIVTGVSAGTSTIVYTLASGCTATATVTVNPLPGPIGGTLVVCAGSTTTLTDGGGGLWSSGATGVAVVGSLTGVVTGVSSGTAPISYTLSTGCLATAVVTVNPLPGTISGISSICVGLTTTYTDAGGGTWTSSSPGVASIGSSTGILTAIAPGTTTVTYTLSSGCFVTKSVTVNTVPTPISGPGSVCIGSTITLTDAGGGTWSSVSTGVATIGSTGVVSGLSVGTTVISYSLGTGCASTTTVTVYALPLAIAGADSVCVGATTSLTDPTAGGSWSSGSTAIATVGSGSGIVTGVTAGTTLISYTSSVGCSVATMVTVDPLPAAPGGLASVCVGGTTMVTDATPGGTWSSGATGIATINPVTGIVNGLAPGTAPMTYTLGTGCGNSIVVTVNPLPSAIGGATNVCVGSTALVTDGTAGGSWTSSNTTIATVGSGTGIVTGVAAGTVTLTYTIATGCYITAPFTVNPLPASISGSTVVCVSTTSPLTDATPGGVWTSSTPSVATIGSSSGLVTGASIGVATITYTLGTGCKTTVPVTVVSAPGAIGGTLTVCAGSTTTLTDAGGGTWSVGSTGIATIGTSTGLVTGVTAGTAPVTYTLLPGCFATATVTVNTAPLPITGATTICIGNNTTLSDGITGGTWSSSNTSVAPIGSSSGSVTGLAIGSATITYTLPAGCKTMVTVSVISGPSSISGSLTTCIGGTTILSDAGGGSWSSGSTSVAVIGSSTGIVTGVALGTSIITYTLGSGCTTTAVVTVTPLPSLIGGTPQVCVGNTTTLTDPSPGGTWSSASTGIATVGSGTGIVTGVAAGTAIISYQVSMGCYRTIVVTVNPLPSAITGFMGLCIATTTTLGGPTGGTWSTTSTSVATVGSSTGIVTGVSVGTATITYTQPTGCMTTSVVTVNSTPPAITGTLNACVGSTTHLSDITSGSWSSGATGVATVGSSTGIVTGVSSGVAPITFSAGTGCTTFALVTVNPLPSPITGASSLCVGTTALVSDPLPGGTWSSGSTSVATIGSLTGIVSGVTTGTSAITYRLSTGCTISKTVTVTPLPAAITSFGSVCIGQTSALADGTPGGTWTSMSPAIATIGSSSGVVTGVAAGTAVISYSIGAGCAVATTITVNSLPPAITGTAVVCAGFGTSLSDATPGGTWYVTNTAIATVGSSDGSVVGVTAGIDTVVYSISTGCATRRTVTVNPAPSPIIGSATACVGSTVSYSDTTTGGTWSSGYSGIATIVPGTGVLTGIASGTTIISYTLATTGCAAIKPVVVNPISPILGTATVCIGQTTTLNDTTLGGTWSCASPLIATVSAGIVTGVSAGTAVITYTLPTSCTAYRTITVNPLPAPIVGTMHVCPGQTTTLTDPTPGGSWSSGSPLIASVTSLGAVTGLASGTATISYTVIGCLQTATFTVDPVPSSITGITAVCVGNTTTLSDASAGGAWSSAGTSVATIGSASGVVTGVSAGTVAISYTLATGCATGTTVTVEALPAAITGVASMCAGGSTTLSDASPGGTWTSANPTVATIDSFSGFVTGMSVGTATITYTLGTGCTAVKVVTVNYLPGPIVGPSNVCAGSTIAMTDLVSGGTWSSLLPSIAVIGSSSGVLTGVSPGTTVVVYSLSTGCLASKAITVAPLPLPISGANHVCAGSSITLSCGTPGGMWTSADTAVASVDTFSGLVRGRSAGVVLISYTTGCSATYSVSVNAVPSLIAGPADVCLYGTATYYDSVSGGIWVSANPAIATIGSSTGVVNGVALGGTSIAYVMPGGCFASRGITVIAPPAVFTVTGGGNHCAGDTGVHIGLSGSATAVNYFVFRGVTAVGSFHGTGSAMDFGLFTVGGVYTVVATSTITGCSISMAGSAPIGVVPSVTPAVTFSISPGDTVCSGTAVTINAVPAHGGSTPTYTWSINSVPVALTSSYTYIPANNDTVRVVMSSSATCAVPLTASHSVVMTVNPFEVPSVSLAVTPADTVCRGTLVTVNALPLFGGTAPYYYWFRNGAPMTGSAGSLSFVPADGDVVYCVMNSNYACRLNNSDTSAAVSVKVDSPVYPYVTINTARGTTVSPAEADTLTASVANAVNPAFQWYVNGVPVPGATSAVYVYTTYNRSGNDSVSVAVTNHDICSMTAHQWVYLQLTTVSVHQLSSGSNVRVAPNPNDGDFSVQGTIPGLNDEPVTIEMTNMVGQVVYRNVVIPVNGALNERISLKRQLANGMYLLSLKAATGSIVFHLVVEQ